MQPKPAQTSLVNTTQTTNRNQSASNFKILSLAYRFCILMQISLCQGQGQTDRWGYIAIFRGTLARVANNQNSWETAEEALVNLCIQFSKSEMQ